MKLRTWHSRVVLFSKAPVRRHHDSVILGDSLTALPEAPAGGTGGLLTRKLSRAWTGNGGMLLCVAESVVRSVVHVSQSHSIERT